MHAIVQTEAAKRLLSQVGTKQTSLSDIAGPDRYPT
jgi:hypothetical protein